MIRKIDSSVEKKGSTDAAKSTSNANLLSTHQELQKPIIHISASI